MARVAVEGRQIPEVAVATHQHVPAHDGPELLEVCDLCRGRVPPGILHSPQMHRPGRGQAGPLVERLLEGIQRRDESEAELALAGDMVSKQPSQA